MRVFWFVWSQNLEVWFIFLNLVEEDSFLALGKNKRLIFALCLKRCVKTYLSTQVQNIYVDIIIRY